MAAQVASFANFLVFLKDGVYASLTDRLLRMRMVYPSSDPYTRTIAFQHINQQLVWDGIMELATFFALLVNWGLVSNSATPPSYTYLTNILWLASRVLLPSQPPTPFVSFSARRLPLS